MRNRFIAILAAASLPACALGASFVARTDLTPVFATARVGVITQTYRSGTVSPPYVHEDELVIYGDGFWDSTRSYPYASPAATRSSATGSIGTAKVQKLVDKAFESVGVGQPRFVDLGTRYDDKSVGGGTRGITLHLSSGTMSVTVVGKAPDPYDQLEAAIAADTKSIAQ